MVEQFIGTKSWRKYRSGLYSVVICWKITVKKLYRINWFFELYNFIVLLRRYEIQVYIVYNWKDSCPFPHLFSQKRDEKWDILSFYFILGAALQQFEQGGTHACAKWLLYLPIDSIKKLFRTRHWKVSLWVKNHFALCRRDTICSIPE